MPERNGPKETVDQQIMAYLDTHPSAADTAEGIARWWLNLRPSEPAAERAVERALEDLVRCGLIQKTVKRDGEAIYGRPGPVDRRVH